jgi:ABC-type transport system involved in multi-copper enzyme maturation permease subunit
MLKIIRAEFRRTFYHRSSLVLIGITILFCVLSLSFQITGIVGGEKSKVLQAFNDTFAFPNSIFTAIGIAQFLFIFIVPTAVGYFIGIDYQINTWKMILPRTPQRWKLLTSKILNVLIFLAFIFCIIWLSVFISALFGSIWFDVPIFQTENVTTSIETQTRTIGDIAFIIWYISLAVLITICSRSLLIAGFATFAFYIFCNLMRSYSPEFISIWFAPTHFGNLIVAPISEHNLIDASRPDVSVIFSWTIIILHMFVNLIISFFVINKQEFSGE